MGPDVRPAGYPRRRLLAVLLAALLAYGGLGHGAHLRLSADHADAGHAVAILCASLLLVVAPLVVGRPVVSARLVVTTPALACDRPWPATAPPADARASPAWLQRFLS